MSKGQRRSRVSCADCPSPASLEALDEPSASIVGRPGGSRLTACRSASAEPSAHNFRLRPSIWRCRPAGGMDSKRRRGDLRRTESGLHPRSVPCPRIRGGRSAGPTWDKLKVRMERIKSQLSCGLVARVIAYPKRPSDRDDAARLAWIALQPKRIECTAIPALSADCRSDPASRNAPASRSSEADSSGSRRSKAGANALLAAECCIENNRWADLLDYRPCSGAAA